jgi:hypothetical protein
VATLFNCVLSALHLTELRRERCCDTLSVVRRPAHAVSDSGGPNVCCCNGECGGERASIVSLPWLSASWQDAALSVLPLVSVCARGSWQPAQPDEVKVVVAQQIDESGSVGVVVVQPIVAPSPPPAPRAQLPSASEDARKFRSAVVPQCCHCLTEECRGNLTLPLSLCLILLNVVVLLIIIAMTNPVWLLGISMLPL